MITFKLLLLWIVSILLEEVVSRHCEQSDIKQVFSNCVNNNREGKTFLIQSFSTLMMIAKIPTISQSHREFKTFRAQYYAGKVSNR